MKITLLSEESIRLEPTSGPLTIEAPSPDETYSPFHMLGSSLATCTFSLLASWATHAGISADDLALEVSWSFADDPHRVGEISLVIDWPSLPANRTTAAMRAAALCPIHATLHHPPKVEIQHREAAVAQR